MTISLTFNVSILIWPLFRKWLWWKKKVCIYTWWPIVNTWNKILTVLSVLYFYFKNDFLKDASAVLMFKTNEFCSLKTAANQYVGAKYCSTRTCLLCCMDSQWSKLHIVHWNKALQIKSNCPTTSHPKSIIKWNTNSHYWGLNTTTFCI